MTPHRRQHHSKLERTRAGSRFLWALSALSGAGMSLLACRGPTLPRPPRAQASAEDYVAVPFAPRPPPVEIVPASPRSDAVWVDGTWTWSGTRFSWSPGGWVVAPAGARRASWVVVRRAADGQLFFAPAVWRDSNGARVADPEPLVRSRSRPSFFDD